jgi:hypothetical protein
MGFDSAVDSKNCSERFFGPFVLFNNLLLLFGGEVILNVELFANFYDRLVLHQASDLSTGKLEQGLNVKVVACHNKFKHDFLVYVDEICVPLILDNFGHISVDKGLCDLA